MISPRLPKSDASIFSRNKNDCVDEKEKKMVVDLIGDYSLKVCFSPLNTRLQQPVSLQNYNLEAIPRINYSASS
jgi:hypothetical protein